MCGFDATMSAGHFRLLLWGFSAPAGFDRRWVPPKRAVLGGFHWPLVWGGLRYADEKEVVLVELFIIKYFQLPCAKYLPLSYINLLDFVVVVGGKEWCWFNLLEGFDCAAFGGLLGVFWFGGLIHFSDSQLGFSVARLWVCRMVLWFMVSSV